ncbi:MAG: hypothetical protein LW714_03625 [Oxalobacteraceae bacterium]|jgi:hypothetical protein|nr:hypothetical protein [Oxalobacteraceae bacterium]
MDEKIFTTVLEEALHTDQTGKLAIEITQRLQTLSLRLDNDVRQPTTQEVHKQITAAQQAIAGAQKFMKLFNSNKN